MQAELELGHDAEVAAASAQAPEEVGVLGLARLDELAVGGHQVDGQQLVDREPVLAHDPADAAAEREPGDPGVGDDPAGRREPERLRLAVELAPEHAGLGPRRRASGSTWMPFISQRSITIPPSQTERPGKLWPPPRTATRRPVARANRTAAMTSATPAQRAISAGRRSIDPFQTRRCSS